MIGAPSHRVKQPKLVNYRVFVQNAGAGARCVKGGTNVLYEVYITRCSAPCHVPLHSISLIPRSHAMMRA